MSDIEYRWRGAFQSSEVNRLHAGSFDHRVHEDSEWDWARLCEEHSLGWVTARLEDGLVGFVNVLWDGLVHAWLQDVMVTPDHQHRGIGLHLIELARIGAKQAGCEWLHVDFDDDLRGFYIDAAGFTPTSGGLLHLNDGA
jgi:GNAT superfamily N-acetyltransferase